MTGAVHYQIGAEAADDVAYARDALLGRLVLLDIHRRFGAKLTRQCEPRLFRRADANNPAGAHFLRGRHGKNADWTGALDGDGVAPFKAAGARRAVESANA